MSTVTSEDGTPIAYERKGSGAAVILVGGGLDDGAENAPLAAELASDFVTYTSGGAAERFDEYRKGLHAALGEGRRGDAVELFMRLAGSADEQVAAARSSPHWPGLEALAHTLAYDGALYGPPPVTRLTTLAQSTLVASGGASGFFEASADAVAASIPKAERTTLAGQGHVVDPGTMAAVLRRFFG